MKLGKNKHEINWWGPCDLICKIIPIYLCSNIVRLIDWLIDWLIRFRFGKWIFLGLALSLWDKSFLKSITPAKMDEAAISRMVKYVKNTFSFAGDSSGQGMCSVGAIQATLLSRSCPSYLHFILVMLLMFRCLGVEIRLVYSMQPLSAKEPTKKAQKSPTAKSSRAKTEKKSPGQKKGGSGRKRHRSWNESESSYDEAKEEEKPKRPVRKAAKSGSGRKLTMSVKSRKNGSDTDVEVDLEMPDGGMVDFVMSDMQKKEGPAKKTEPEV